jgi:8-oxo-dGTP pyrophosphatase MutT (NUDIX family)
MIVCVNKTIYKYASGGIVFCRGRVLTLKIAPPYNEIVFPKGTIEKGETPERTAVREIAEETGYDAHVIAPIGVFSYEFDEDGNHYHKKLHYFILALSDVNQIPVPRREEGEKFENLWLPIKDAKLQLTHDNNKEMLTKALKIIRVNNFYPCYLTKKFVDEFADNVCQPTSRH